MSVITISFSAPAEMKDWLEKWAAKEDRSVSATMRQILKQEAARRQIEPGQAAPTPQTVTAIH